MIQISMGARFTVFAILGCALTASPLQGQKSTKPKPDLTGTWLHDTAKGNVGASATSGQPIKIVHHDPELRVTRMVESNSQVTERDFVYYTDGRGETNPTLVALTTSADMNRQAHDKDVTKSHTTWSGNKLVTRSTLRSLIAGRQLEFEIIDEWKLSSDGKTLTQNSRTVLHQDTSGAIFVPAQRPDIKRVYKRVPP